MLFNSVAFLLFFPLCLIVYYLLSWNKTIQNIFLLLASYVFYANFEPRYLILLVSITLVSYVGGGLIQKSRELEKKHILVGTILLIVAPLLFYKYFNFTNQIISDILSTVGLSFKVKFIRLLLPIGISFYTFQAIGYVVDVYQRKIKSEKSLLTYALFLGFFPQIASGPIGRAPSILPQIKEKRIFNFEAFSKGFGYLIWGYFLKLVIADRGGIYVDTVFNNYPEHSGISLLLATFIYSFQIYGDFAGYSLMALGTAKMMGFDLINNFKRPYLAVSVSDFWRRWHISLSTWFRDYVYIPLGGNRVSPIRHNLNILLTFIVSGIWHGAAYNFILWGGLHGVFQIIGKYTESLQNKLLSSLSIRKDSRVYSFINILVTFILVSYAWMVFRINDINDIWEISKGYFKGGSLYVHITTVSYFLFGLIILIAKSIKDEYFPDYELFTSNPKVFIRQISLIFLIAIILLFGVLDGGQFIYFTF